MIMCICYRVSGICAMKLSKFGWRDNIRFARMILRFSATHDVIHLDAEAITCEEPIADSDEVNTNNRKHDWITANDAANQLEVEIASFERHLPLPTCAEYRDCCVFLATSAQLEDLFAQMQTFKANFAQLLITWFD